MVNLFQISKANESQKNPTLVLTFGLYELHLRCCVHTAKYKRAKTQTLAPTLSGVAQLRLHVLGPALCGSLTPYTLYGTQPWLPSVLQVVSLWS